MARKTKPAKSTSVIGYIRVSSEEQAESGQSLESQREKIEAYCAMRSLTLVNVAIDAAVSGGKPIASREGGKLVLESLRKGLAGGVVSVKLDRVFRSTVDCLATVEDWTKAGHTFHLIDLGGMAIDTSTAAGKMFLVMLAGMAEFERSIGGERTSSILQAKKSRNEFTGGAQAPYGFEVANDGKSLGPVAAEQETIERARELDREGLSLRGIASKLASEGRLSRTGREFYAQQIKAILVKETEGTEAVGVNEARSPRETILEAIRTLSPKYRKLVPIWAIREVVDMPKAELDALLLDMAGEALLMLKIANDPTTDDVLKHGIDSGIDQRPRMVDGKRTDGRGLIWYVIAWDNE